MVEEEGQVEPTLDFDLGLEPTSTSPHRSSVVTRYSLGARTGMVLSSTDRVAALRGCGRESSIHVVSRNRLFLDTPHGPSSRLLRFRREREGLLSALSRGDVGSSAEQIGDTCIELQGLMSPRPVSHGVGRSKWMD